MQHLTPIEAHEFLKQNKDAVLVDIRSELEFLFVGHPEGAINIAWYDTPDWDLNPRFISEVRMAASHDRPILLICRSGKRTLEAGKALEEAGLTKVYNVLHGFEGDLDDEHHRSTVNGWRQEGLPWAQC